MSKKIAAGADFFQTQAVYDADQARTFLAQARALGKPILLGIMPLKSLKMAEFVDKNITGITVPKQVFAALEQGKTGFDLACEFISEIYQQVDGLHIFGMGDVGTTNKLVEYTRSLF